MHICTNKYMYILWLYAEECQIHYINQPPPELPCNPYLTIAGIHLDLVLGCDVRGPFIEPNSFDYSIVWMRQGSNEGSKVEELSKGSSGVFTIENVTLFIVFNDVLLMKSGKYSKLRIRMSELSQNMVVKGTYWCQVIVFRNSTYTEGIPLQPSRKTMIHDRNIYHTMFPSTPPCLSNIPFSVPVLTCVDLNSSSHTVLTEPPSSQSSSEAGNDQGMTVLSNGMLVVLAACGGVMLTVIIILSLIVVCSCLHIKNITHTVRGE